MNFEQQIKIQSYLDGELSLAERKQVEVWLEQDQQLRQLRDELQQMSAALRRHEPVEGVPDTREFYWTGIERAIQSQPLGGAESVGHRRPFIGQPTASFRDWARSWWLRLAVPAAAAVLLVVAVLSNRETEPPPQSASSVTQLDDLRDIEIPTDDVNTFAFHSEAAGMTVVWVETVGQ